MRKWLYSFVAAAVACGTVIPVAASTTSSSTDHAYINSNTTSAMVGSAADLRLVFAGSTNTSTHPPLQVQTTLGTLNGQGSSVTVTPDDSGNYADLSLTSTVTGTATISVFENGLLIGSTQVSFTSGALGSITVKATPTNATVGGTSVLTINAYDIYGNAIADNTPGTTFNVSTTGGQLVPGIGINTATNTSTISIGTHNGMAQVLLSDFAAETDSVTVTDTMTLPNGVTLNGNAGVRTVSVPVTFSPANSVSVTQFKDFNDVSSLSGNALDSVRELQAIGVLNGDPFHNYNPYTTMDRSEFAEVVAQYMGLSGVAANFSGVPTRFTDVNSSAWYNGAVAADTALGYIHGYGNQFYPNMKVTYAQVAMILLNNLGVQTTGTWPNNAISGAQTYGLFNGLGSFDANQAATRTDVAIMVRNALHLVQPSNANGKTMEAEELGYTWYGADQGTTVTAVPNNGVGVGNEVQVQTATQSLTLHLANNVQVVGATSLNDLMNKKISYLTNVLGLVTYIEVTP